MKNQKDTEAQKIGKKGEDLAVAFLKEKGYQILDRNYRYKRFEIDIIARYNGTLVFTEVKTRTSTSFGHPEEFVSEKQQRQITEAADEYIFNLKWEHNIRYDIIAILLQKDDMELKHFEDSFY